MKTIDKIKNWLCVGLVALGTSAAMVACDDDDTVYAYDSQLHAFGPSPATRGETIRFIGEGLGSVNKIIFPVGVEVTDFVSKTDAEIVVVVPQEAVPGRIRLLTGGNDILTKSVITFSEPISVTSVKADKAVLVPGDLITITGDYLYNVATVTFGGDAVATPENFVKQERHTLVVKVPGTARSGAITLSDGDDWSYTSEQEFTIDSAEVTGLDPDASHADYGETIGIVGTNLQLVVAVYFPGDIAAEFTCNPEGTYITATVPAGTGPGQIELELVSEDRILTPAFTMPSVEVTGISPETNVVGGTELTITGKLLDRVAFIEFPGGTTMRSGWAVDNSGTSLQVKAPANIADGCILLCQNENLKVPAPVITTPHEANQLWKGSFLLEGDWSTNFEVGKDRTDGYYELFSRAITGPGTLIIDVTLDPDLSASMCKLQPRYRRDWKTPLSGAREKSEGIIAMARKQKTVELEITAEDIAELNGDGWAFSGCYLTLTSFKFIPAN